MRPDRVSATTTRKVWNRRVNALSGLSKLRPDLQYQWVLRKTEYPANGYGEHLAFPFYQNGEASNTGLTADGYLRILTSIPHFY